MQLCPGVQQSTQYTAVEAKCSRASGFQQGTAASALACPLFYPVRHTLPHKDPSFTHVPNDFVNPGKGSNLPQVQVWPKIGLKRFLSWGPLQGAGSACTRQRGTPADTEK